MTNFIPIFPLGVIVYPTETIKLHIFEERYIQMINECIEKDAPFGIIPFFNGEMKEMGTIVKVVEVLEKHENNSFDIRVTGQEVFKTLEVINSIPDKLYSGAIVHYPTNVTTDGKISILHQVLKSLRVIFDRLNIKKDFSKPDEEISSYDLGHLVGMSMEDEYRILELMQELHRLEFIKRHLIKLQPLVTDSNQTKDRIKLDGHFKNLEGFSYS